MPRNRHDQLFKATFSQPEHAAGELRHVLPPALVARIDFATLQLVPGSFVDERLAGKQSDVLFSATIAGRRALVYILFEHQSRADPRMPFRLLTYLVRIWEAYLAEHPKARKLPIIVPLVLHHGLQGWTVARSLDELLDADEELLAAVADHIPRFRFLLDDITGERDAHLRARTMSALGRLVLFCLRHGRKPRRVLRRMYRWDALVRELLRTPGGGAALEMLFRYILGAEKEIDVDELRMLAAKYIGHAVEEEIVNLEDRIFAKAHEKGLKEGLDKGLKEGLDKGLKEGLDKGLKEGLKEGLDKGRTEGQRATLLKLLHLRFGALPSDVATRVEAAGAAQLDRWIEGVLSAATLADALRDA